MAKKNNDNKEISPLLSKEETEKVLHNAIQLKIIEKAQKELSIFLDNFSKEYGFTLGVRVGANLCIELVNHGFSGNFKEGNEIIITQLSLIPTDTIQKG